MDYNARNIVDLHVHSTASDGSLDPLEIVALAVNTGLKALSLTDHDVIDGCRAILRQPQALGPLQFLTGVEISAGASDLTGIAGSFHILGYGFDPDHPALNDALHAQQSARKNRNPKMIALLNDLGIGISLAEVIAAAEPNAGIGRPHIARLMVQKGVVASIDEAFDRYLGKGRPAYLEKTRIGAEAAIRLIREAGGVAVLAHPGLLNMPDEACDGLIARLAGMGLQGLEVYYPGHEAGQTAFYSRLAHQYGLLVTGGSDFHGAVNPDIRLGVGRGDLAVPYALYEALMDAVRRARQGRSAPREGARHE